jgi:SagB-type dehydrogenase family enzyme
VTIEAADLVSSQASIERAGDLYSPAELFLENTKLRGYNGLETSQRILSFFADPLKVGTARMSYKSYATAARVALPPAAPRATATFDTVVRGRRSARLGPDAAAFAPAPMPLADLAYLLFYTYGVTGRPAPAAAPGAEPGPVHQDSGEREPAAAVASDEAPAANGAPASAPPPVHTHAANGNGEAEHNHSALNLSARRAPRMPPLLHRTSPSGGGMYPLELYPVVLNVEGLEPGVYHYNAYGHYLELLRSGADDPDFAAEALELLIPGTNYDHLGVVLVTTAVCLRSVFKYGERGYRFLLIEAGHAAQNSYLAATALGLSLCALGGFLDEEVNRFLGVDGLEELALYVALVGSSPVAAAACEVCA